MQPQILYRYCGRQDYVTIWQKMQDFHSLQSKSETKQIDVVQNEVWFVEHNPVFTLGRSGKAKHLLQSTTIPLVKTDRGGQITYHAPGQLIVYCLFNLKQLGLGIAALVRLLEQLILSVLARYAIEGHVIKGAPGVYVQGKKIAAIGLRVSRFCCYHGFALNVNMDLAPFLLINPCGYNGLQVTDMVTSLGKTGSQVVHVVPDQREITDYIKTFFNKKLSDVSLNQSSLP